MKLHLAIACLLLCTSFHASAQEAAPPSLVKHAPKSEYPKDASEVAARKSGCLHWSRADTYGQRGQEAQQAMQDLQCSTIDQDFAAVRAKYADNPKVAKMLDGVEGW
ncbi:hypothetical protein LYSHEL_00690 [Lysobacter helvus]|uniref:Secreted protein n=2 Tax=Lysobacteraceae TaxID=32033 RepID=A0ABN6FP61_9GAMM|nr:MULTISPECIES: hypothetical protein [Lysobacter]BCT91045.1 hypothetical protein LYSCAS_00690 [Lysobacter caseinilyticus]BCT94198.1 hypothetical protein LYSHEL_00690 [Lysobacter helvus]